LYFLIVLQKLSKGIGSFNKEDVRKSLFSQALVTHAYNPSYTGGRDQEDCSLKSAPGK
jgi:hypothetical protein